MIFFVGLSEEEVNTWNFVHTLRMCLFTSVCVCVCVYFNLFEKKEPLSHCV